MRAIFYHFKQHKKINGTLFYCFEYFLCAKKMDPHVQYVLTNISDVDLEIVKDIFKEKYVFDHAILNDVISVKNIKGLYDLNCQKNLTLDIHTFDNVFAFLRGDILSYSNHDHPVVRSTNKKITYYGFYDYQPFDYKVNLKFYFDAYKPLAFKDPEGLLVSSMLYNYKDIIIPPELKHLEIITKQQNQHIKNVHELFDTLYYYHSGLDTNNRLIPECFFYGKKVVVEFNNHAHDSVYFRYHDILDNGLAPYTLNEDDLMLQHFLN